MHLKIEALSGAAPGAARACAHAQVRTAWEWEKPAEWAAALEGTHVVLQGLSTEQVPVSAYGGSLKNLKDLKDLPLDGVWRL